MDCICENLFMGDLKDAYNIHKENLEITHVLTVDSKPLPSSAREGLNYLYVHCLDLESFDLLTHIPECLEFIDEGRRSGAVLVHCFAGQSRSGAVVMAYLMQHLSMNVSEALQYAKEKRPAISPNEGFMKQLKLFGEMGNSVDHNSRIFKHYQLKQISEQFQMAQSPESIPEGCLTEAPSSIESGFTLYKCRKCRKSLFGQPNIISHVPKTEKNCNQTYFIEPLIWMKDSILQPSGKIACPGCNSKLGSFSWIGKCILSNW